MKNTKCLSFAKALTCVLIGFICITFTSRNSFLFSFQDSRDIQIFLTTARGILDGDVLYRDIFEVKGPYLYVIYVLGLMISRESLIGVYLIEGIIFSAYMFISYKIARMFVKSVPLCFVITAITGFVSTTTEAMDCGGQCEELLLPVFSVIIYVTVRYFKSIYPKRIPALDVLVVAICFAIIFWMKYTLVGLVLGLILYLVIIQIRDKTMRNIPYYVGLFLLGIILATLPIIVYFTYHNAWESLWDAYFYKLLFSYKPDTTNLHGFGTKLFWEDYIAASCFTAYAFIYSCVLMIRNTKGNKHPYGCICAMLLFQAIGISFSRNWQYTPECMHTFNALGLSMFAVSIVDAVVLIRKKVSTIAKELEVHKSIFEYVEIFMAVVLGVLLLINRKSLMLPILILAVLSILLLKYIENWENAEQVLLDWKKEYQEKKKMINTFVYVMSAVILALYTHAFSKTSFAIGVPLERYPQYKMSQYILNSNIENPIIVNYDTTDAGIYGFTKTAPPTKWVGDYNAGFDEVKAMYEEYIDGKKADFIISESKELKIDGYQLVYSPGSTVYIDEGRKLELFLYAKVE